MIRVFCFLCLIFSATLTQAENLKLAVTTSFENSGLADILVPQIAADTGINVQLLVVGTGQALRLGEAGDVDAILVHSRASEDAFIKNGFGTHRREIMYNDFVLIGPVSDDAMVADAQNISDAVQRIASSEAVYISRGDESGTHKAEQKIWAAAALDPDTFGSWYLAVGAGMGAALNTSSALNAYILSDRASWLNFGNKGDLKLLYSGDPSLFNQYSFIPVNPENHASTRYDLALKVEDWLTSNRAAKLINDYTINDEKLFVFNATDQ